MGTHMSKSRDFLQRAASTCKRRHIVPVTAGVMATSLLLTVLRKRHLAVTDSHSLCDNHITGSACRNSIGYKESSPTTPTSPQVYKRINLTYDQANGNLKSYLDDLLARTLAFQIPAAEVCDIRDAVEEIVCRIVEELKQRNDDVKVRQILKVGSFYDGTKICNPDEFDFLVVLDAECFTNGRSVSAKQYLMAIPSLSISQSVDQLRKKNLHKIKKLSGKLQLSQDTGGGIGPASTISLHWKGSQKIWLSISVDITPAICVNVDNLQHDSSRSNVKHEVYKTVIETGTFLLIYKRAKYQETFTETEAKIIKNRFSQKHRDVLKILKYIYSAPEPRNKPVFTTYELKLYMIHHYYTCSHDVSDSISYCLFDVLQYIREYAHTEDGKFRIPHLFLENHVPCAVYINHFPDAVKLCIGLPDKLLHELLVIANNELPYSFEQCSVSRVTDVCISTTRHYDGELMYINICPGADYFKRYYAPSMAQHNTIQHDRT